jgi:beta-aspartyl-peptidase (threonine type)
MNSLEWFVLSILALFVSAAVRADTGRAPATAVLVIHGGAGVMPRAKMTAEREKLYRADLEKALRQGYQALERDGGTSVDAVEAAIKVLEDAPLFNAGKGAVFTHDGRNELDASIMDGKGLRAGAVAAVTCIKNPISAARAVMEKSEHVMLVGRGAELFATQQHLEIVDPGYFWTRERWLDLERALEKEKAKHDRRGTQRDVTADRDLLGTVGAVAIDRHGNLAAGTSTGGMTNKRYGRVGDSPIIGAGTYAENGVGAVSATGHGEIFIRHAVAHDIIALMKYKKLSVAEAAREVMEKLPTEPEGVGGVIALDNKGNFATPFNTEGMFRGYVTRDGAIEVAIYRK